MNNTTEDNYFEVYIGDGQTQEVPNEIAGIVYSGVHDKYIYKKNSVKLAESSDLMVNHEFDLDEHMRFINDYGEAENILPNGFLYDLVSMERDIAAAETGLQDGVKLIVEQLKAAIKRELSSMSIDDNNYEVYGFSVNVTEDVERYYAEVYFAEEMTYSIIFDESHLNIARYLADETKMDTKLYERLLGYVAGTLLFEGWIDEEN